MTLKELRMWHWRRLLDQRNRQRYEESKPEARDKAVRVQSARDACNLHLGAVQALNDHVPGTAEQDCEFADAQVRDLKPWQSINLNSQLNELAAIDDRSKHLDIGARMDHPAWQSACLQCGSPVCLDQTHTNAVSQHVCAHKWQIRPGAAEDWSSRTCVLCGAVQYM